ncbi:cyclin-D5-1-like isoform X2 [Magnolia sinica]|uniref:cyclin-D5-1-like isoform X2 n=1 Tax=Magnolia sinica TaxID=86752 RepID=UPI002657ACC4|nr:cyclin-D5-1-like isoform X2 [Magnolia sinica]
MDLSGLLCQEVGEYFLYEEDEEEEDRFFSVHSSVSRIEDEYIEILAEKEISFQTKDQKPTSDDLQIKNLLKCSRLDAVRWMLEMRELLGLRFQTAFLSVSYLDRFLSGQLLDNGTSWVIWLLSIACLSLAAKMEEHEPPELSKYQMEEFDFKSKLIQRMELHVLNALEWRMSSITPFAFLNYFAAKLCSEPRPKGLLSKAVKLVVAATEVEHRPSAIAAAAIFVASDQQLTRKLMNLKMGLIVSFGSSMNESVFSCYELMWELEKVKSRASDIMSPSDYIVTPPDYSSSHPSDAAVTSAGCKRKLAFGEDYQSSPKSNKKNENKTN